MKDRQPLRYGARSFPEEWTNEQIRYWKGVFIKVFNPRHPERSIFRNMNSFMRGGQAIDISRETITSCRNGSEITPSDWCGSLFNMAKRVLIEQRHWDIFFLHYLEGLPSGKVAHHLGLSMETYKDDTKYISVIIGKGLVDLGLYPLRDPVTMCGFFDIMSNSIGQVP